MQLGCKFVGAQDSEVRGSARAVELTLAIVFFLERERSLWSLGQGSASHALEGTGVSGIAYRGYRPDEKAVRFLLEGEGDLATSRLGRSGDGAVVGEPGHRA